MTVPLHPLQWQGGISRMDSGMMGYLSRMESDKVVYPGGTVARWDVPDGQWQGGISRMDSGKVVYPFLLLKL